MRPQSIRMFDYLYLGALALGVVNFFLSRDAMAAQIAADPATAGFGSGFVTGAFVFAMVVSLLLWFLVSRKGSTIALWILIALFVIGLAMLPGSLATMGTVPLVLSLAATAMQAGSIFYLFKPDAKAYLAGHPADPSTFD